MTTHICPVKFLLENGDLCRAQDAFLHTIPASENFRNRIRSAALRFLDRFMERRVKIITLFSVDFSAVIPKNVLYLPFDAFDADAPGLIDRIPALPLHGHIKAIEGRNQLLDKDFLASVPCFRVILCGFLAKIHHVGLRTLPAIQILGCFRLGLFQLLAQFRDLSLRCASLSHLIVRLEVYVITLIRRNHVERV